MELSRSVNSGKLRSLKPILDNWVDVIIERYIEYFDGPDSPWWYNERATVSSLAAAVWMTGGTALEEYRREKGSMSRPKMGRCDLLLGCERGTYFECEAKQGWIRVGLRASKAFISTKTSLKNACIAARDLKALDGVRRLALCFAVPYLPVEDKDHVEKQVCTWLKDIEKLDCDSVAWAFPEKTRCIEASDGHIYPGVVLLVKEV